MTNEHVVEQEATVQVFPASGGGQFTGEVLGTDALRDLAVVKACCKSGLRALELATPDEVRQGAEVVAFGYPYRAGVFSDLSVSDGIISTIGYYQQRDSYTVQTTAEINPGNSGGPLVNMFGKVVGTVRSSIDFTPGGRPIDGIGFAVASRTIRDRLTALESGAGRTPTPTPTITPSPTPIPTPSVFSTPVPSGWSLLVVAVGDSNQRVLDAGKRRAIAYSLGLMDEQVPKVEDGFRMVQNSDQQNNEVYITTSGDGTIVFTKILSSFDGYKPLEIEGPIRFFGRVCRDGSNCNQAYFQNLLGYISLDEDVASGRADISPWMKITASIPVGHSVRIEMIAYYTSDE